MRVQLRYVFIGVTIVLLSGCAFFTSPKEQPVKQDYVGPIFGKKTTHVFSLTPERRTVIVMPTQRGARFCAEPPPDVAESLADSLRILAEAQLKDPKLPASASMEFYKAFTSSAMSLFY